MALDKLQPHLVRQPDLGGRVFVFLNGEVPPGINVAAANLQDESGISQPEARVAIGQLAKQATESGETFAVGLIIHDFKLLELLASVVEMKDALDPLQGLRLWLQKPRPASHVRIVIIDPPATTMHVFDSEGHCLV